MFTKSKKGTEIVSKNKKRMLQVFEVDMSNDCDTAHPKKNPPCMLLKVFFFFEFAKEIVIQGIKFKIVSS